MREARARPGGASVTVKVPFRAQTLARRSARRCRPGRVVGAAAEAPGVVARDRLARAPGRSGCARAARRPAAVSSAAGRRARGTAAGCSSRCPTLPVGRRRAGVAGSGREHAGRSPPGRSRASTAPSSPTASGCTRRGGCGSSALVLTASLGVAYGFPLGPTAGLVTFAVVDGARRAAAARAPRRSSSSTTWCCAPAAPGCRCGTSGASPRSTPTRRARCAAAGPIPRRTCAPRGWISRSVLVEVDDDDDPHPYWLVSTRHGDRLAPILAAARDRHRRRARLPAVMTPHVAGWPRPPSARRRTPRMSNEIDASARRGRRARSSTPRRPRRSSPRWWRSVRPGRCRRVSRRRYTKATGNQPPRASDPDASLRRIIIWAATTAVAVAVVNVVVDRMTAPRRVQG